MNTEMLKVLGLVKPKKETTTTKYHGFLMISTNNFIDHMNFRRPDRSRLYMGILKLMMDGRVRTIYGMYSCVPGTHKSPVWQSKPRWSSHSILTALVQASYIKHVSHSTYQITGKGRAYYTAATAE